MIIDFGLGADWEGDIPVVDFRGELIDDETVNMVHLIKEKAENIKAIDIVYSHFHIDHVNNLNPLINALTQIFSRKIEVNLYINQNLNKKNQEAITYNYFGVNFYTDQIKQLENSIANKLDVLKRLRKTFESKIRGEALDREDEEELKEEDIRAFEDIKIMEALINLPNDNDYYNEVDLFFSDKTDLTNPRPIGNNQNLNLRYTNLESLEGFYPDIKKESFFSHAIDHCTFKIVLDEKKTMVVHLGDDFPFWFALNHFTFSNYGGLLNSIKKLYQWIKEFMNGNEQDGKRIILIPSHKISYKNKFFAHLGIFSSFVNIIELDSCETFKTFLQYFANNLTKYAFPKRYFEEINRESQNVELNFRNQIENLISEVENDLENGEVY